MFISLNVLRQKYDLFQYESYNMFSACKLKVFFIQLNNTTIRRMLYRFKFLLQGTMNINRNILFAKCLKGPSNNEIIWLSIFQAQFENDSDLMSLMLRCLQDRILTVSEFIEPAQLFVFNLLCTHCVLCNIRRKPGAGSQHQSQVSEIIMQMLRKRCQLV